MRGIFKYLVVLVACSLLAFVSAVYGFYELKNSEAIQRSLVFEFADAEKRYEEIGRLIGYGKKLPFIFEDWRNEVAVKTEETRYWQKIYTGQTGVNSEDKSGDQDPQLMFIRANSEYRKIETSRDRKLVIEGLERAINAYVETIKSDSDHFDGAFNYEYLLRTREEVANNKRPLPLKSEQSQNGQPKDPKPGQDGDQPGQQGQQPGMHGKEGAQGQDSSESKIRIHIPIDSDEAKEKGGQDAGKGDAKRRKG